MSAASSAPFHTAGMEMSPYMASVYEEKKRLEKKKEREGICLEVVALVVGFIGLIGVAATTGLPMWRVTAFIGENIIVMEVRWEGLWMNCFRQANIRMQCKVYDSLLYLPSDLQAARGLMCTSVAFAAFAMVVSAVGMRGTRVASSNPRVKHVVLVVGGALFLGACITILIPVSWTAHVIIQDFYNPLLINAQRRELGEALYIGWLTGGLLFSAGMMLMCRHAPRTQDDYIQKMYGPGSGYDPYTYQPDYATHQPVYNYTEPYTYKTPYSYQPAYTYQPAYSTVPPPGSVIYAPSHHV